MKRLILLPLITVTLALAACGGSSTTNSSSGSSKGPAASGGTKSGHTTITVWQGDTEVEAAGFKTLVAEFNADAPAHHRQLAVLRQQRLRAAEGAGRDRRWQAAGHLLPVRLVGAQHRHQSAAGPAQQVHRRGPELQLERLLPRRAQGRHRRQQHHRGPRAGRQPRAGLQQEAVQAGGHPAARRPPGRGATSRTPPSSSPTRPRSSSAGPTSTTRSEDTVWRFWAMLWQAGGSILTPDGKQAAL